MRVEFSRCRKVSETIRHKAKNGLDRVLVASQHARMPPITTYCSVVASSSPLSRRRSSRAIRFLITLCTFTRLSLVQVEAASAEYIAVRPADHASENALNKLVESDTPAKLSPQSNGKWEVHVKGSDEVEPSKFDVVLPSAKAPANTGKSTSTNKETWIDFTAKVVN